LIGPGQSTPDRLNERTISLKSKLAGFSRKRRLVCDECKLVLHERAERFGNEVELPGKLLVGPAQPIQSDPESLIQFGGTAALKPCV
jgi:hypothetical protein